MSVKVAVRLRPFNSRELELHSSPTSCVQMQNNTTVITDPKTSKVRDFSFDYSFWSHDGFTITPEGLYVAANDIYADQKRVFDSVGEEVLRNAMEGYHCCLFAYGQTGSGKSYSMLGYGPNKGIVPVACEELFKKIEKDQEQKEFQVLFSMLEIYNEKVQDLLVPTNKRAQGGLKVREHKIQGVYVEGLSKHPVKDYQSIDKLMDIGNRNKTIGATLMNATSSRSHTIISLEFKQVCGTVKKTEKISKINLVDLAGSEKLAKTGASGDRMKEGCLINKSLTVLGIVIAALAEKSQGKAKGTVVPFRDSVLTRILQNALGGNSKTLMICALSPSENNYEETLSTLRYADQAKKIKCNAVINESEQDKIIRELRIENEKLREMLLKMQGRTSQISTEKLKEMEEELIANNELLKEYEWNEKPLDNDIEEEDFDFSLPYLMNINEDPLLNGKALYSLKPGLTHIGKKTGNPVPDIVLGTLGIKPNHAIIRNEEVINDKDEESKTGTISNDKNGYLNGRKVIIEPYDSECGENIFVNGKKISRKLELKHNDRLVFAGTACFLVKIPGITEENEEKIEEIDWEFVQREIIDNIDKDRKKMEEIQEKEREFQAQEKIRKIEDAYKLQQKETELLLDKQKRDYKERLQELELELAEESERQRLENEKNEAERQWNEEIARLEAESFQKELERERQRKELFLEENAKIRQKVFKRELEQKLRKYIPKITEINLIAKELERNVYLSIELEYRHEILNQEKPLMAVLVENFEENAEYSWSLAKFRNRYMFIKELFDRFLEVGKKTPFKSKEDDPFWDPIEPICLGTCYLKLMALAYLVDNQADITIMGINGSIGNLSVDLIPTDIAGVKNLAESFIGKDDFIEKPEQLIGRRLDFRVKIDEAVFPGEQYKDVYIEYEVRNGKGNMESFKSNTVYGTKHNPKFRYSYHHYIENVDAKILEYLLNGDICFKVFGIEDNITEQTDKPIENDFNLTRARRSSKTLLMSPRSKKSNLLQVLRAEVEQNSIEEHEKEGEHEEQELKEDEKISIGIKHRSAKSQG